ncbi:MAG: hypothetical protein HKN47_06535 [Pirellulaceae bacterium]|nr:hypothetical protein [Pirellulaceae bacterium]
MALEKADASGIRWLDPREAPFRITGLKWISSDKVYRRLPVKPDWEIRKAVDSLANSTAGAQIHFQTDSEKILVRVWLPRRSGMYHMPATGQSGFDLYVGPPGELQYRSTTRFDAGASKYEVTLLDESKQNRNVVLNFPLYNGVQKVQVGLVAGCSLTAPPAFDSEGPIVVYGTSITQGGCAARPGMAYSNILSRRLNLEFVNLGFSGNGKGEPELAKLINQIDNKKMVVLDYEANVSEDIRNTLENFIDILRFQNPRMPILVMSKILYSRETSGSNDARARQDRAEFQRRLVETKRSAGDQNIFFLDGSTLLGEHAYECTVDGVHPTDLGFLKMANTMEPVIKKILANASE